MYRTNNIIVVVVVEMETYVYKIQVNKLEDLITIQEDLYEIYGDGVKYTLISHGNLIKENAIYDQETGGLISKEVMDDIVSASFITNEPYDILKQFIPDPFPSYWKHKFTGEEHWVIE